MLIMTNAGVYTAVQHDTEPDRLTVYTYDLESAQIAVDGLEMLHGEECPITSRPGLHMFHVDREHFADWVAEEIRQYLTYPIFELALEDSRGEEWMLMHSHIKGALMDHIHE